MVQGPTSDLVVAAIAGTLDSRAIPGAAVLTRPLQYGKMAT